MTRERAAVDALMLSGTPGPFRQWGRPCAMVASPVRAGADRVREVVSAPAPRIGAPGAALEVRRGVVDARTLTFVKEGIRIAP